MGLLGCLPLINGIGDLLMPYRYLSESNTILNYEILDTDEEQYPSGEIHIVTQL